MGKPNRTSKPIESEPIVSGVAVIDTPTTDTPPEPEPVELNDNEPTNDDSEPNDDSSDDSSDDNESEPEPETLSEMMARNTAEKLAAIEKREQETAAEKLAITLNITNDVVRLIAVDLLNSESFVLPDEIKLETGTTIGLALEYNVDSKSWSMAIDAVVKLPRVRTVASGSESPTAQNTIWFTSFTNPTGTKYDAPMLIKSNGETSETRNDLVACEKILGFNIKNNGQYTMNAGAKQKRITEHGWTFETAQNFES
jgi:hypothetical protein